MSGGHKTYWHLRDKKRIPSEYEIVTSRLLYYPEKGGFAVRLPTSAWYARYQQGSPLRSQRWEEFADPRATTYTQYVHLQREQESHTEQLLRNGEECGRDGKLEAGWLDVLEQTVPVLRFVFHGLQMAAAYVGQMAPSGRIAVTALFQTADELRRVHGLAHRMAQLRQQRPTLGDDARLRWQSDPAWQPLREAIERLLVTYDWGEALVALNLCLRPAVEELFWVELATLAERRGDCVDALVWRSYLNDGLWQRDWTARLLRLATDDSPDNAATIEGWRNVWSPVADKILAAATLFGAEGSACGQRIRARLTIAAAPEYSQKDRHDRV